MKLLKPEAYIPVGEPLLSVHYDTPLMRMLYRACTTKRGHGTFSEAMFVSWLAKTLPVTMIDGAGNLHIDLRTAEQRTLFTAHSDTVTRREGANAVLVDRVTTPGQVYWRGNGDTLGADDGAGLALIAHLIANGVAGYYIIFRGEERGGIGSKWVAREMPELLNQFDRAIAFDRAGYGDVITHQACGRCCSDQFAQALADQLGMTTLMYMPDPTGVYTDTAEFVDVIPECTNLSVGYKHQHSDREWQNVTFLQELAAELLKVEWETLPTSRSPAQSGAEGGLCGALVSAVDYGDYSELDEAYPDSNFSVNTLRHALDLCLQWGGDRAESLLDKAYLKDSPDVAELQRLN